MMKKYIIAFLYIVFLIGCGGGSSSDDGTTTEDTEVTGELIDSPISGVSYSCNEVTGVTSSEGKFNCSLSSTVAFTIADIYLGSYDLYKSDDIVYITPSKLYGLENNNITDTRVLNFIQFIQSLDSDGNVTNGIEINSTVRNALKGKSLDISDLATTQEDINSTLLSIGITPVPLDVAIDNYVKTLNDTLRISLNPEPYYYQQWYLDKDDTFYEDNDIDENANIHVGNILKSYTGSGVKIAVIDNGLDMTHEDLKGAVVDSYDIDTGSTDVSQTNYDDYHGTAVTGIISARVNNKGIKGVASQSQIIFIKYKEEMTDSEIIELFNKAEEYGADVVNCSWGTYDVSESIKDKIVDLANNGREGKGISIVFSTGNNDQDMGNDESSIPEVISVGATDKDNERAWYSNYGENLDVMAPGGYYLGITTLDPMGEKGVATIDENYLLYDDDYAFVGTSASAPIVSGVIALMLEKNPNLTRIQIEDILHNSADKIGDYEYINGRNDYYGYGKINLEKIMSLVP